MRDPHAFPTPIPTQPGSSLATAMARLLPSARRRLVLLANPGTAPQTLDDSQRDAVCAVCGQPVWVARSSLAVIAAATVVCTDCVVAELKKELT